MQIRFDASGALCALSVTISLMLAGPAARAATALAVPRQVLHGHVPAAAAQAKPVGRLPATDRLNLAIGLPFRNAGELAALVDQLYDPASPLYHQYLSAEQATARFGPTEQDYHAMIDFLKANGLTVHTTFPNRMIVSVAGTVADIERTLHVNLLLYQHPEEARTFFAPDTEPSLDLPVPVLHISGLDNYVVPRPANLIIRQPGGQGGGTPLGGGSAGGNFMGRDFRAAYVPGVPLTGQGQFVGLFQLDGYYPSDIAAYASQAGMTNVPLINVLLDGVNGTPGTANIEVALDIDMAMSMAPGLSGIIVYEGAVPNDILNRMAVDNVAKQLSASWTFPTDATTDQIFQLFAVHGQSFFCASGDWSSAISAPADNPRVISVGGTTLTTRSSGQAWSSETAWNWNTTTLTETNATGGGVSTTWPIPSWQQGIDMSTNLGSTTMRNVPDVAMVADQIQVVADHGSTYTVGGTSASSPLWAGFMALVNQQAALLGQAPGGFINPAVYALGKSTNYTTAFHDIKTGNNTNRTSPTLYYAVTGYDLCTGWGTPTGKALINALVPPVSARVITNTAATLTLETAAPANGAIDPGEAVTVSFTLQNIGAVNTTNLVATLQTNNGITPLSGPQTYGALIGLGTNVIRSFTFLANGTCGQTINPVLQLQDGATNLGTLTFSFQLGTPNLTFAEKFDSVVAPALPAGWTTATTVSNGTSLWTTTNNFRDSPPNSAVIVGPYTPGISELISPVIPISTTTAVLSFRNCYTMEANITNSTLAYDGGVLEIKIGSGSFTDILTAGSIFVSGGYTATVDPNDDNPLPKRRVWSGTSPGFTNVVIRLPTAAAGQNIQLKWRLASDTMSDFGATIWYVDNVAIQEGVSCASPATNADLAIGMTSFPDPALVGQDQIYYSLSATNLGPGPGLNVTVTDPLPAGVVYVGGSPGVANIGNTVVCSFGFMTNGARTNVTIAFAPIAPGYITNTAVISSLANDPNPDNSTAAVVTLVNSAPIISSGPASQTVTPGTDVTFSVLALGTAPLSYQWSFNGTDMAGETAATLLLTNVQSAQTGSYVVTITNMFGSITSAPAILKFAGPPTVTLSQVDLANSSVVFSLASANGLNYTLEYKNSLTDPQWIAILPAVPGTGGPIVLQDTNAPAIPSRFYRVRCN